MMAMTVYFLCNICFLWNRWRIDHGHIPAIMVDSPGALVKYQGFFCSRAGAGHGASPVTGSK
jgi:hypothetical protein